MDKLKTAVNFERLRQMLPDVVLEANRPIRKINVCEIFKMLAPDTRVKVL